MRITRILYLNVDIDNIIVEDTTFGLSRPKMVHSLLHKSLFSPQKRRRQQTRKIKNKISSPKITTTFHT